MHLAKKNLCLTFIRMFYFPVAQKPNTGIISVIVEISVSHTIRHTTIGMTPLGERSARRRYLYLTSHNNTRDKKNHALRVTRTRNPKKREAADLRLRPPGHLNRPGIRLLYINVNTSSQNFGVPCLSKQIKFHH